MDVVSKIKEINRIISIDEELNSLITSMHDDADKMRSFRNDIVGREFSDRIDLYYYIKFKYGRR